MAMIMKVFRVLYVEDYVIISRFALRNLPNMKNVITNPFVTGGYVGPACFCNRSEETKRLSDAISSRRNITLISTPENGSDRSVETS
jgi:hypothetical protein